MGQNLIFVPECHSTNDLALQLCQQPATPEGTVVITASQAKGRGQRGNTWEAEPGMNLTFSTILKPHFLAVRDQFYLNRVISLALHDYLKTRTSAEIRIKWPNDIIVDGKKICGVLIENQIRGDQFQHVVIGTGLNINQRTFTHPGATSLSCVTGVTYDLQVELESLLTFLEARYLQLREGKRTLLADSYQAVLFWRGEPHRFSVGGVAFEGVIDGVREDGVLQVQTPDGLRAFHIREIVFER